MYPRCISYYNIKKSKPSIFSLNHSGEIALLPNETSVSAAAIHSLTERMNNIISKCSLLSLDRRGEKTPPPAKTVSQLLHLLTIQCSVQCRLQFPDEWITVQCRNICGLVSGHSGTWTVPCQCQRHFQLPRKPDDVWLPAQQRSLADESQKLHGAEL